MASARLYATTSGLALETPYNPALVAALRALPATDRRWDGTYRRWIVAAQHGATVAELVREYCGVVLDVPPVAVTSQPTVRVVKLVYLGRCRPRGDETSASGYADGGWTFLFPESVLRAWFADTLSGSDEPAQPRTLYAVLGITRTASADDIKRAHRRLAMQWHPDRCREPDAREQFERIQHAYETLRDERQRRKYDAGLRLEASQQQRITRRRPKNFQVRRHDTDAYGYRAPLRCGLLVVDGQPRVGQFVVQKIHRWDDIVDNQGRTMISSWPAGATIFEVQFV